MSNNEQPSQGVSSQQPVQPVYAAGVSYYPAGYTRPESPLKKKIKEAVGEISVPVLAFVSLVFGILESRMIIHGGFGFGVSIVAFAWYLLFLPFILKKGRKIPLSAVLMAIPTAALAVSFIFNGSGKFFLVLALIAMFMLQTAALTGCADSRISFSSVSQTASAHVPNTFSAMGVVFPSLFKGEKKAGSSATKVLAGVLISVPVVAILLVGFSCADSVFGNAVTTVLNKLNLDNIMEIVVDIVLGAMLAAYFLPLAAVLRSGYREDGENKEPKGFLDGVIASTVLFIASVVYVLFCAVQFRYLFAVQLGYFFNYSFDRSLKLPDNMTWAEYARSGFFELSAIIICTFIAAALIIAFTKKEEGKTGLPAHLKTALTLISSCNVILVLSAVLRMRLYTIWCGLTAKRVTVLMMILFIFISLILLIVKAWNSKTRLLASCVWLAMVFFAVYGCMNVDALCARVNVSRYLEEGTTIDIGYLSELSESAAPSVQRLLLETDDPNIKECCRGIISNYHYRHEYYHEHGYEDIGFGGRNLGMIYAESLFPRYKSRDAVKFLDEYIMFEQDKREFEKETGESFPFASFDEYRKRSYDWDVYEAIDQTLKNAKR